MVKSQVGLEVRLQKAKGTPVSTLGARVKAILRVILSPGRFEKREQAGRSLWAEQEGWLTREAKNFAPVKM
jgi:hypothetical protein